MRFQLKSRSNLTSIVDVEPSYWAVKDQLLENEWEQLSELIQRYPGQVLTKDCTGGTLLHQLIGCYSSSSTRTVRNVSLANGNNSVIGVPSSRCCPPNHVIEDILASPDAVSAIASQNFEGLTPLHLCCQSITIPDKITISLAKRNPAAIAIQDEEGDTPLHSAFRFGASDEVLKTLIELSFLNSDLQNDDSSCFGKFDYEGDTPLHKAIFHEASCSSIQLYMDVYPQGIFTTNCKSQTPLHIACEQKRYDVAVAISQSHAILGGIDTLLQIEDCSGLTPTAALWHIFLSSIHEGDRMEILQSIACLLLPDVGTLSLSIDEKDCFYTFAQAHRLMEACIKFGDVVIPDDFVSLLIQKHSKLLCSTDDQGRLPIHKVAMQPSYGYDCVSTTCCAYTTDGESSVGNKECCEPKAGSILNIIYSSYPEGAHQYDNSGKLPIHVALEEGSTWQSGVKCISKGVLRFSERCTGLYPFMLAAVPANRDPCLETIFQLLRGCPDLITIGSDKNFEKLRPRKRQRR